MHLSMSACACSIYLSRSHYSHINSHQLRPYFQHFPIQQCYPQREKKNPSMTLQDIQVRLSNLTGEPRSGCSFTHSHDIQRAQGRCVQTTLLTIKNAPLFMRIYLCDPGTLQSSPPSTSSSTSQSSSPDDSDSDLAFSVNRSSSASESSLGRKPNADNT